MKQEQAMTNFPTFADWLALCNAKARHCRALDTKDWATYEAMFTEDFVLVVSEGTEVPAIKGRDAAVQHIKASILTATTAHQIHAPEIDIDGDVAQVIWGIQSRVIWSSQRPSITGYGHYHERWVRQHGEWKLAAQKLIHQHIDVHPATTPNAG